MPVGKEVMRVSATDIDNGNNSVVFYRLDAKKIEEDVYFQIDENSGAIYLRKPIDVSFFILAISFCYSPERFVEQISCKRFM